MIEKQHNIIILIRLYKALQKHMLKKGFINIS